MIEAVCHCGACRLEVPRAPRRLTSCNCSICRRSGSLMAYYKASAVRLKYRLRDVQKYSWGDRWLRFVRCRTCGCFLHWEQVKGKLRDRMGVNARNFDPKVIARTRVRRFDGAMTWKFLD
jgi:hypothetical protein